jgi:CMP-N-acetylneuraminic acid synthetase
MPDTPSPRRQELRPYYHPTGTIYIANIGWYRQHETFMTADTLGYKVQPWQDHEIDDEWDLNICAALMDRIK